MDKVVKLVYLMVSGSVLWVIFTISLPVHQMLGTQNLTINATDSFISQAYADESESKKHKNKNKNKKHKKKKHKDKKHKNKNKDKDKDKDKSENKSDDESSESSSSYDFSSATLVCISRSTVLSALDFSSEGGGGESDESDESDEDNSNTVTQSYITSLPGCTVFASAAIAGIWIPFMTITTTNSDDNETSLNSAMILDYFTQLGANTAGLTGTPPSSTMVSYREVLGE